MFFPVHCVVYICDEYLCRQGLILLFLSVISNIGHSEVLTFFMTFLYKVIQMMTNAMENFKLFMLCWWDCGVSTSTYCTIFLSLTCWKCVKWSFSRHKYSIQTFFFLFVLGLGPTLVQKRQPWIIYLRAETSFVGEWNVSPKSYFSFCITQICLLLPVDFLFMCLCNCGYVKQCCRFCAWWSR